MTRPTLAWRTAMVLATASLALTACGNDNGGSADKPKASESASESPAAKGDGTLTVGTLLPQTGDLAFLGPPEFAGVQTAIDDINAAGGVLGKDVVQVKADSGDGTPDIAGAQTDKLLDANADVVVGAASSSVSLSVLDKIAGAGAVMFSPANTSTIFDEKKTDPKNTYFRTAPSDVLQGAVLSNLIIEDGHDNIAILARQDAYGEALARETTKGIKAGGGNVVVSKLYSADATNFTAEVNAVAAKKPDAVVAISFDEITKLIPQMIAKGIGPKDQQVYFVDGDTKNFGSTKTFAKGTLDGVRATYPGAELTSDFKPRMLKTDPKLKDFTYGPESFDATTLTALAATEAKSDAPSAFKSHIISVSSGGTKCTGFKECADLIKKGEDVDYEGVSGPCDMAPTGSPTKATIGIFEYDATNNFKNIKYVTGVTGQ